MKNILYITMCLPYDKVGHAGGKTVNYYANRFSQEEGVDVRIISKIRDNELEKLKIITPQIKVYPVSMPNGIIRKTFAYLMSINSKFNPYSRYGNTLTKYIYLEFYKSLKKLKLEGYTPDVVILEWTEIVLFIEQLKKIFPDAYFVASEHDVKFQSLERKYLASTNTIDRFYKRIKYKTMRKNEIQALDTADLVVTQSDKDEKMLAQAGVSMQKQLVISPYFMKSNRKWIDRDCDNIVIYGDMSRLENYESAIWFIENVFNEIKDENIKLIVLGGNPPEILKKYSRGNILVTGYVDNIFEYLDKSYCMVAPLQLGAGIKVKCIEALSYGIPLVTNKIGIEGIGAEEYFDFLLCNSPTEFRDAVIKLRYGKDIRIRLSNNAINYAERLLDVEKSFLEYKVRINV